MPSRSQILPSNINYLGLYATMIRTSRIHPDKISSKRSNMNRSTLCTQEKCTQYSFFLSLIRRISVHFVLLQFRYYCRQKCGEYLGYCDLWGE